MTGVERIRTAARREAEAYRAGEERPLGSYLATMGTYGASVAALVGAGALAGKRLPDRISPYDLVLLGVATHKLSRLVAKDTVTAPLRAPFTEFAGPQGQGELHEEVRGHGARHTVGELITCPFCLAQWVATAFTAGLVFAPRATRLVAGTFSTVAISDALQNVYAFLQRKAEG
ncbi:MAG TPA: DUF1360 domain-containing protein [Mycobacteriales bacterium]|jgi:hypothetical protein|nr:DUF1360 domain-containing protein [Mycobacteriales bacterium]